jgi:hypothetical protein
LKNDSVETLAAGLKIIPRPPVGFRVLFLAFLLRGLSLPLILSSVVFFSHMGFSFTI